MILLTILLTTLVLVGGVHRVLALPPDLKPATPSWNGDDQQAPSFKLRFSGYLKEPSQNQSPLWCIWEKWESPDRTRAVVVYRYRFKSRKSAVDFMKSTDNPGRINFGYNNNQWDQVAVLGSRSLSCITSTMGSNRIWFIQDKELVDLEYYYPSRPVSKEPNYQRTLQIGRTIIAKIQAGESGANEPDEDDTTPPTITVSATPAMLWPPNKKMVPIAVNINAQDDSGIAPVVTFVGVTSSAGGTSDISIGADGSISLRATRAGNENQRTYTITYKATDRSGNSTSASTTVIVPHDQGH